MTDHDLHRSVVLRNLSQIRICLNCIIDTLIREGAIPHKGSRITTAELIKEQQKDVESLRLLCSIENRRDLVSYWELNTITTSSLAACFDGKTSKSTERKEAALTQFRILEAYLRNLPITFPWKV